MPYPAQLIFISEYFRLNPDPTPEQENALKKWFWITTYANYFTLYSISQQRSAYQVFCDFAQGKHPDGIYKVTEDMALPTSWGKMFVHVTFWAQALRPYRTNNVGAQCLRPPLDNFFYHHKYGRAILLGNINLSIPKFILIKKEYL